jgi:hypothetical protein
MSYGAHTRYDRPTRRRQVNQMMLSATMLALALIGGGPKTPAIALAAAPAKACLSVDRTGTFRVVTKKAGGTALGLGLVVLENINGCLEATFITDDSGPAIIDGLSVSGDTLKGNLKLTTGSAKLMLQFAGASVTGSIVQGGNEWSIEGRKTS